MARGHIPGGGIASNKRVEKPVRTGSGSYSTNPGYVSQLGNKVGDHITERRATDYRGEIFHKGTNFQPTEFGNANALKGGDARGKARTIHATGSQQQWGDVAGKPAPQSQDTLAPYGPDRSR